jgi:anti-sigma regulatory factor (Ser/Thr protein kinase)
MTALICVHRPLKGNVEWLSCGAPDLMVIDPADASRQPLNPEKRGGIPIGMLPDTQYSDSDVVNTSLTDTAVCVSFTDGIFDLARDKDNNETMPTSFFKDSVRELVNEARTTGAMFAVPQKIITLCEESGYRHFPDDVTLLMFGKRLFTDGVFDASLPLHPETIENTALELGEWCAGNGWDAGLVDRVQLVLEEALMNVHDHGVDPQDRLSAVVGIRLCRVRDMAELTIWDSGTPPPSLEVAAGDSGTAMELKNREFSGRGRGRLIIRSLCKGISRSRYQALNETVYHIPFEFVPEVGE